MFLGILLFQLSCLLQRDIGMLDSAQVGASVGFDDDKVASFDLESGVFLDVEDVGAVALEGDNVQKLILMTVRETSWLTAIGTRHGILVKRGGDSR
jgi:hypothetical protein